MRFALALLAALVLPWPAAAGDLDDSVILVAKRQLHDRYYGATILVARSIGQDQHIGFILNRPTKLTLGELFPQHAPSRKVPDPVFLGGPVRPESIFALVSASRQPAGRAVRLMPGIFVVFDVAGVDRVIEKDPHKARFLAGLVAWRSGELRDEIRRGAWYVLEADAALVMRKPDGLWEELVQAQELRLLGI